MIYVKLRNSYDVTRVQLSRHLYRFVCTTEAIGCEIALFKLAILTVLKFTDCQNSDTEPFYHHCWKINTIACERLNMMLVQVPVSQNRGFFCLIIFNEIEFWCD